MNMLQNTHLIWANILILLFPSILLYSNNFICQVLFIIFFDLMAHNGPAVYDVLAARTGKRKGVQSILTPPLRLQGGQNVAEVLRGSMPQAQRPSKTGARAAEQAA
jgi:hypothetical protein